MEYPGFIGGSYQAQSGRANQERTINFYVEPLSRGSTTRAALFPTPGFEVVGTATAGPGKAHFYETQSEREFAVIGETFWEIDINGTLTSRGTVSVDANPATISYNGDGGGELFITSGGNGYIFTLSTDTLSAVAALAGKATMGDYLDGYFLCLDASTSTFYISDLLDGTTWDPTQFSQRSIGADPWQGLKVANRYVYLMGSITGEVWYNAGTSPFPFAPHPSGALVPYGTASGFSMEVVSGSLMWLGASANGQGPVLRMAGFTPEPISNYAVENQLDELSTISDAIGDTYDDRGHTFYLLTLPTGNETHTFDASVPPHIAWTERGTWMTEESQFQAWRPLYHVFAYGEHRWLDRNGASVYRSSSDLTLDVEDRAIRRVRRAPALVYENQLLTYAALELDLEVGLGTSTGQGSDPQVMLRMSDDGGKTWGNELMASAGKIGEYEVRVRWNRLGQARRRAFEIAVSDPIPWRVTNAYLTMSQLPQGIEKAA